MTEPIEYFTVSLKYGGKMLVDVSFLRSHPLISCENGRIFRYITGIEKHPSMEKDQDIPLDKKFQSMFEEYAITRKEWLLFMSYLMTGEVYMRNSIKDLVQFCAKVGLFHIDNDVIEKKNLLQYNPMTPEDDVKGKYQWRVCLSRLFLRDIGDNWSACNFSDETKEFVYYRRDIQEN